MSDIFLEQLQPARLLRERLAAWLRAAWRAWQNRRAARRLAALDDRLLVDIGLRRGDVERAFSVPLWQDPTQELNRIATARRRAWRRR